MQKKKPALLVFDGTWRIVQEFPKQRQMLGRQVTYRFDISGMNDGQTVKVFHQARCPLEVWGQDETGVGIAVLVDDAFRLGLVVQNVVNPFVGARRLRFQERHSDELCRGKKDFC